MARPGTSKWGDFDGLIDEVYLYDHVLTSAEISSLYNSAVVPEPSSLVLWSALGLMGLAGSRRRKRQAALATTAA